MVESVVSATEAYQEFEKRNNRFVNMLTDNVTHHISPKYDIGQEHPSAGSGGHQKVSE